MNLILLRRTDFINDKNMVRINDRRFKHILKILKADKYDKLSVGLINEKTGTGTVTSINQNYVEMEVSLSKDPPPPLPLTLILALPRPKVLKRIPGVPVTDAIFTAMKTGLTMSAAGITATIVAFLFSNSIVIKQIMIILIIGLIIDILTTWLQNAGLLKLYFERKEKHE